MHVPHPTVSVLALALFGALAFAPAAAAQQHDMAQHDKSAHVAHAESMPKHDMMAMMDPDGDGKVSAAEHAAAAQAMFAKADADKDGSLTHAEMMAAHAAMGMGPMKDGKKMACSCCEGGEGGMKGCGMGDKPDPVGEALSGK